MNDLNQDCSPLCRSWVECKKKTQTNTCSSEFSKICHFSMKQLKLIGGWKRHQLQLRGQILVNFCWRFAHETRGWGLDSTKIVRVSDSSAWGICISSNSDHYFWLIPFYTPTTAGPTIHMQEGLAHVDQKYSLNPRFRRRSQHEALGSLVNIMWTSFFGCTDWSANERHGHECKL